MSYPIIDQLIAKFEGYGTDAAPTITAANNPGAIADSDFARSMGAIGSANGFAVFPTPEHGWAALDKLASFKIDAGATPITLIQGGGGVSGWAPPSAPGNSQSGADAYSRFIADGVGMGLNDPIRDTINKTTGPVKGPLDSTWAELGTGSGSIKDEIDKASKVPMLGGLSASSIGSNILGLPVGWGIRLLFIVLGLVFIIFGLYFFRPVQDAVNVVVDKGRKVAEVAAVA